MFATRVVLFAVTASSALLVAACGGDDGERADYSPLEGIYEIEMITRNDTSCVEPGLDVREEYDAGYLVGVQQSFFGAGILSMPSCLDLEACRDVANELTTEGNFAFSFGDIDFTFDRRTSDGAEGTLLSSGFGIDGTCQDGEVSERVLTQEGESITIRVETVIADDYPPDDEGFCTTDAATAAATGNPCGELMIIEAVRVEGISRAP